MSDKEDSNNNNAEEENNNNNMIETSVEKPSIEYYDNYYLIYIGSYSISDKVKSWKNATKIYRSLLGEYYYDNFIISKSDSTYSINLKEKSDLTEEENPFAGKIYATEQLASKAIDAQIEAEVRKQDIRLSEYNGRKYTRNANSNANSNADNTTIASSASSAVTYQGIPAALFFEKILQDILLATSYNDFNHDFGHEKILDYLNCINKDLISINSVEFEKKRLLFAMGAGGETGEKLMNKVNKKKSTTAVSIPEIYKNMTYISDIGKRLDSSGIRNIDKIYSGIAQNASASSSQSSENISKYFFVDEFTQINKIVGFDFKKFIDEELNPTDIRNYKLKFNDAEILSSLNALKTTREFSPVNLPSLKRKYHINPVPVKVLGKKVYLPGAIKRATGDNSKVVILIDASNLSMKSLGANIKGISKEYEAGTPITILILINNANLADSAMKLSKEIDNDENETKLKILFATEDINTTTYYPRPDKQGNNSQNKALFNNFLNNITTKEEAKRISARIQSPLVNTASTTSTSLVTSDELYIQDLGEESEISKVSAKIILDYLENDGNVSVGSMVRANTKKMGDSCQAISLLDLDRPYYYCDINGLPTDANGNRVNTKQYFTLSQLKLMGWVIYLLTHDKVLLSIALLLGINILYTIKLLFRFDKDLVKEFGSDVKEEDSTSRSITWLLGFQNANDIREFTNAMKEQQLQKYAWVVDSTSAGKIKKIEGVKELIEKNSKDLQTYFINYIKTYVSAYLKDNSVDETFNVAKLLQYIFTYISLLKSLPKITLLDDYDKKLSEAYLVLQTTTSSPYEKQEAVNVLERIQLELTTITNNLNTFKEEVIPKLDSIVEGIVQASKVMELSETYHITDYITTLGFKYYSNMLKYTPPEGYTWEEYLKNYNYAIYDLKTEISDLKAENITLFDAIVFPVKTIIEKKKKKDVMQPNEKIKQLYDEIQKIFSTSSGGGVTSSKPSTSSNNASNVNSYSFKTPQDLLQSIYTVLSINSVTILRDKGILLKAYNKISKESISIIESLKQKKETKLFDDLQNNLNALKEIKHTFDKVIYHNFFVKPKLNYIIDENEYKYFIGQKFKTKDDLYYEIPIIDEKLFNVLESFYYSNINIIQEEEELYLLFKKLFVHYYEILLLNLLEEKKQYLKLMAIQFMKNNFKVEYDKALQDEQIILNSAEDILTIFKNIPDDYIQNINEYIDKYADFYVRIINENLGGKIGEEIWSDDYESLIQMLEDTLDDINRIFQTKVAYFSYFCSMIDLFINRKIYNILQISKYYANIPNLSSILFALKDLQNSYPIQKETFQKYYNYVNDISIEEEANNQENENNLLLPVAGLAPVGIVEHATLQANTVVEESTQQNTQVTTAAHNKNNDKKEENDDVEETNDNSDEYEEDSILDNDEIVFGIELQEGENDDEGEDSKEDNQIDLVVNLLKYDQIYITSLEQYINDEKDEYKKRNRVDLTVNTSVKSEEKKLRKESSDDEEKDEENEEEEKQEKTPPPSPIRRLMTRPKGSSPDEKLRTIQKLISRVLSPRATIIFTNEGGYSKYKKTRKGKTQRHKKLKRKTQKKRI